MTKKEITLREHLKKIGKVGRKKIKENQEHYNEIRRKWAKNWWSQFSEEERKEIWRKRREVRDKTRDKNK